MPRFRSDDQKKERMACFIDCTRQLIEEDGYSNVSIRKIASRAGYHNSTIYFYFNDLDYLLALASVRTFEQYSKELAAISSLNQSNSEVFYPIWECFARNAFEAPDLYNHFFFGKYCNNITELLNQYYQLFPEEKLAYSDIIQEMYFAPTFSERCLAILLPLIGDPRFRVTEENLTIANDLSIASFQKALEQKILDPSLDTDELTRHFLKTLHFIMDA